MPSNLGRRCPYPDFYTKIHGISDLPIDSTGACIFHSQIIDWKRENSFDKYFLQLIQILNSTNDEINLYDFTEFVFVGSKIETSNQNEHYIFRVNDISLKKEACFLGASFLDSTIFDDIIFTEGADFQQTTFKRDLEFTNVNFGRLDFDKAEFLSKVFFTSIQIKNSALFCDTKFSGATYGFAVKFDKIMFDGITSFSDASFSLGEQSSVGFLQIRFNDVVDFTKTNFLCHVVFRDISFAGNTDFTDTLFGHVISTNRYRGSAVQFNHIEVAAKADISFKSTSLQNKMFQHDVQIDFSKEPLGIIRFENVNFSKINTTDRDELVRLAKLGKVEIGSGCIKYRFQTDKKNISISHNNALLVLEICQTFTNYFTVSNGLNLGFEIVEKTDTEISFFYFTDENISETIFFERLARTERNLWDLLCPLSTPLSSLKMQVPISTEKENAAINAVDGVSALFGTFFRVGVRIACGRWRESDTKELLNAIRFNNDGNEDNRTSALHKALCSQYKFLTLKSLISKQNKGLLPMKVDFAILTIIEVELHAVCSVFGLNADNRRKTTKDGNIYWYGEIHSSNGHSHSIVVARQTKMGNVNAESFATQVIRDCNPKFIFLVGIAASAVPEKIKLGDVVVADSVWYYEYNKVTSDRIEPQPEMIPTNEGLLRRLAGLREWDGVVSETRPDGTDSTSKKHQGVIASGEKVIADKVIRNQITAWHRKILAIEMEGYGFYRATLEPHHPIPGLIIRGICDEADDKKNDNWHKYAAQAAAEFTRHFISDSESVIEVSNKESENV
jgi:nucleoside phosphorylase